MRRLGQIALVVFVVVAVSLGVFATTSVRQSFPDTSGTVRITGLDDTVTVARDDHGIPVIEATTESDLFFAQGYVHAQDRFWEMDFRRHVTAGRLSELVGSGGLETDRFVRTLGWRRVAEQEWELLAPETRTMLQDYARGVNAYIEGRDAKELSLEYQILDLTNDSYEPDPWEPVDSIAWAKAMAWDLRSNMTDELTRTWLAATQPIERVEELYPDDDPAHEPIVAGGGVVGGSFDQDATPTALARTSPAPDALARRALAALESAADASEAVPALLGIGDGVGSNSWVVGGEHTASGKPLLANDPHLAASMPGIWYQQHLRCAEDSACDWNATGFGFTGMPSLIVGHNAHGAWGVTNLYADVADLYLERVEGDTYLHDGEQRPVETREEIIEVAGSDPETLTVRSTHHGPIISDLDVDYAAAGDIEQPLADRGPYDVALQWTALTPQPTLDALPKLGAASSWQEFREAAEVFTTPSQNLVYADVDGNIGYQAPGMVPVRGTGDGRWPVPGWDPDYEWTGTIPFTELPTVLNPDDGVIVTANNRVIGDQYQNDLGADVAAGYRSERIRDLLAGRNDLTVADMTRIQLDNHNAAAEFLVPHLLQVRLESAYYRQGLDTLRGWDLQNDADSRSAAFFNAVWRHTLALTFHDELPERAWPSGGERWVQVMSQLVEDPDNAWWDDVDTTTIVESRDEILAQAMRLARDELTRHQSRHPLKWTWGAMHRMDLVNPTLGTSGVGLVERLFNRGSYEIGGGAGTVNATSWNAAEGYEVTAVPSMRMVVDLADLDASRWINLTGNSGHAFHRNYTDQTELWVEGRTLPWRFSRGATNEATRDELTLVPPR